MKEKKDNEPTSKSEKPKKKSNPILATGRSKSRKKRIGGGNKTTKPNEGVKGPRPSKKQGEKGTETIKNLRINEIMAMMVNGASRGELLEYNRKIHNVSDKTTDADIAAVKKILKGDLLESRENQRALLRKQIITQYIKANQDGSYKAAGVAASILELYAKIFGLDEPTRIELELSGKIDVSYDLKKLDDSELLIFQNLLAKANIKGGDLGDTD